MVVAENGFLLLLGVAVGTVSGLLAVAPHLGEGIARLPWVPLLATILAVVVVGLVSCTAAVWSALKAPLLPCSKRNDETWRRFCHELARVRIDDRGLVGALRAFLHTGQMAWPIR